MVLQINSFRIDFKKRSCLSASHKYCFYKNVLETSKVLVKTISSFFDYNTFILTNLYTLSASTACVEHNTVSLKSKLYYSNTTNN